MSRSQQENVGSCLEWIYKTPRKLSFEKLYRYYFDFILRLLYRVIVFEGIPETVDETFFKLILFTCGRSCFFEGNVIDEGEQLLALNCSRAETPSVYYMPRKALVANPRLIKSYTLTPGKDCEIVYLSEADRYNLSGISGGLYRLIERTATMLADNDISINISQKNTRLVNLVSADTQNTVDSIRAVISSMYEGDPTIVVKSSLVDKLQGIPILQNTSNTNLVELIEVQQYIISHFYEQIGITTHDQMKRERLITAEINDNIDLAFLNIDDIIASITEGLERVNAMFGTSISCKLNPIIERQRDEAEAAQELEQEAEAEPEAQSEEAPEEEPAAEEPEEEAAPEEEAPEEEPEAQSEEPEEEPAAEEPEEEAAPEEEAPEEEPEAQSEELEEVTQDITLEISGDNNTIIISGGDSLDDPTEDDPADVDLDNDDGARGD